VLTRFGRYEILERLGQGGMAEVFKGRVSGAAGFEKIVAVKRILPNLSDDEMFVAMFIEEAKLSANLSHGNIAQIYEFGEIDDQYYIVMEYVHGKNLRAIHQHFRLAHSAMPIPMVLRIALDVCSALDYAHNKGDAAGSVMRLVHRDVSPPNVLVSFQGSVKLIDFGIAKALTRHSRTATGMLKGKLGYLSPEQADGQEIDCRSDLFAVGTLLWEMTTGGRLFFEQSDMATLVKVRKAEVVPPSQVKPGVPSELDAIVLKALARDPDQRFQRADMLYEALEVFANEHGGAWNTMQLARWMVSTFGSEFDETTAVKAANPIPFRIQTLDPEPIPSSPNQPPPPAAKPPSQQVSHSEARRRLAARVAAARGGAAAATSDGARRGGAARSTSDSRERAPLRAVPPPAAPPVAPSPQQPSEDIWEDGPTTLKEEPRVAVIVADLPDNQPLVEEPRYHDDVPTKDGFDVETAKRKLTAADVKPPPEGAAGPEDLEDLPTQPHSVEPVLAPPEVDLRQLIAGTLAEDSASTKPELPSAAPAAAGDWPAPMEPPELELDASGLIKSAATPADPPAAALPPAAAATTAEHWDDGPTRFEPEGSPAMAAELGSEHATAEADRVVSEPPSERSEELTPVVEDAGPPSVSLRAVAPAPAPARRSRWPWLLLAAALLAFAAAGAFLLSRTL
jgi:serine/threonine-protein kinase